MKQFFYMLTMSVLMVNASLFSQELMSPDKFLGYELGARNTPHYKVVEYFKSVERTKPHQVQLTNYGKTNELRELYVAVISSPENIKNLEKIKENNLINAGLKTGNTSTPDIAIIWLSYNVHGNENSATEASMKTIYSILKDKKDWLKNTVVIIDPCVNPDGYDRYVNWYRQTGRFPFDPDVQAREHDEPWPKGRPNHYLFDLNRDWMWATQIETQSRLKVYNQWMPHIHADYHEQGINDKYYFAPAAKPYHEIITPWQREFQIRIGKNNARYFDNEGLLYFTRERFDLLYPSYGDTYPTYMGAIGMTYEQAGNSRGGLGVMTKEKEILSLVDRINNQTITSLSNVEMASKNAIQLNEEFKKFFQNNNTTTKSYVLKGHPEKLDVLTALLDKHEINYEHASNQTVSGYSYASRRSSKMKVDQSALVIHADQPKGKMVKALFEPNAKLEDSLTYDITAWSLPYAYGLEAIASENKVKSSVREQTDAAKENALSDAYAYVMEWNSMADAKFLSALLKKNIKVRFTEKPFTSNGNKFNAGSLIITQRDNENLKDFKQQLSALVDTHEQILKPITSGFSETTPDIGSGDVQLIHQPKVAIFGGEGVSSLSYGEVWHYFEQELKYPITSLNPDSYAYLDLDKYDVIILPSGNYNSFVKTDSLKKIENWIKKGGRLIGIQGALNIFASSKSFKLKRKKKDAKEHKKDKEEEKLIPYAQRERHSISNYITGAIFKTEIDNSHPLAFGYHQNYFSLKLGASAYTFLDGGFNVGYLKDNTVYSGFAGYKAKTQIENTLVFGEERKGQGSIIYFVDNVLFRGFWENGKLFMANATFFVNNDGD